MLSPGRMSSVRQHTPRLPLLALRQRVPVSPLVRGRRVTVRILLVGILERLLAVRYVILDSLPGATCGC